MPYFTYDTSVIISRGHITLPDKGNDFLMSSVVLLELIASANDDSRRKLYERLFRDYGRDNSIIVPNEELARKVLFWLSQIKP
jgi:hypothetical protein